MSQGYGQPAYRVPVHNEQAAAAPGASTSWAMPPQRAASESSRAGEPNAPAPPSPSWQTGGYRADEPGGGYRHTGYEQPPTLGEVGSFQDPSQSSTWAESNGRGSERSGRSFAEIREEEALHAQVRNAAISRMQFLSSNHAQHAWELRRRRPIGPHVLAFLYAVLDPKMSGGRPFYEVRAASRRFRDGDDVQDLVRLLAEMYEIARDYETAARIFDPLAQMTQRTNEVPPGATYIGLGVSSLDTPAATWKEMQTRVSGPLQIPGRCLVTLTDGTRMLIDRPADLHLPLLLYANRSLSSQFGLEYRTWRPLTDSQQSDPVWAWMEHLSQKVVDGQVRMAAAPRPHRGR